MTELSLVLLPGLDGTGKLFTPLIKYLPDQLRPVVVSYPRDIPYGYEDLLAIVQSSLPKDRKYIILGESFSGPLALLAAHHPQPGLIGIVLCATFVKNPFLLIPSWLSVLSFGPLYSLWPLTIRIRALFSRVDVELINAALEAVKSVKPAVIATRVKSLLRVNVEKELKDCPVPILYIESIRDRLIKKHNVERICHINKEVKVVRINTSHFVLQLAPEEAAKVIGAFTKELMCHS